MKMLEWSVIKAIDDVNFELYGKLSNMRDLRYYITEGLHTRFLFNNLLIVSINKMVSIDYGYTEC